MKNSLCFLPAVDEKDQKKVFFLFEYTHDGQLKSDQVGSTDRAVSIIQTALTESSRNIVIDTSAGSGRNLLSRLGSFLNHPDRIFLAALLRTHRQQIADYWNQWGGLTAEERKAKDTQIVEMFQQVRTLGGRRPLTEIDKLTLRVWQAKSTEEVPMESLHKHPAAQYLRNIVQVITDKQRRSADASVFDAMIKGMVYQLCQLVQDPFPLEESESISRPPHFRFFADLFLPEKKDESFTTPENIIFDVINGKEHERNRLQKHNKPLWSLIVETRRFFDKLFGSRAGNRVDVSGIFRTNCLFEKRILLLFDQMLCMWTEALAPKYSGDELNFVDHELFSEKFAADILDRCKESLRTNIN